MIRPRHDALERQRDEDAGRDDREMLDRLLPPGDRMVGRVYFHAGSCNPWQDRQEGLERRDCPLPFVGEASQRAHCEPRLTAPGPFSPWYFARLSGIGQVRTAPGGVQCGDS